MNDNPGHDAPSLADRYRDQPVVEIIEHHRPAGSMLGRAATLRINGHDMGHFEGFKVTAGEGEITKVTVTLLPSKIVMGIEGDAVQAVAEAISSIGPDGLTSADIAQEYEQAARLAIEAYERHQAQQRLEMNTPEPDSPEAFFAGVDLSTVPQWTTAEDLSAISIAAFAKEQATTREEEQ